MNALMIWLIMGTLSFSAYMWIRTTRISLLMKTIGMFNQKIDLIFMILFFVFGFTIIPFILLYLILSNLYDFRKWLIIKRKKMLSKHTKQK